MNDYDQNPLQLDLMFLEMCEVNGVAIRDQLSFNQRFALYKARQSGDAGDEGDVCDGSCLLTHWGKKHKPLLLAPHNCCTQYCLGCGEVTWDVWWDILHPPIAYTQPEAQVEDPEVLEVEVVDPEVPLPIPGDQVVYEPWVGMGDRELCDQTGAVDKLVAEQAIFHPPIVIDLTYEETDLMGPIRGGNFAGTVKDMKIISKMGQKRQLDCDLTTADALQSGDIAQIDGKTYLIIDESADRGEGGSDTDVFYYQMIEIKAEMMKPLFKRFKRNEEVKKVVFD